MGDPFSRLTDSTPALIGADPYTRARAIGTDPTATVSDVAGTTYTIGAADVGRVLRTTSAAAISVTLPNNQTVPIPVGSAVTFQQGAAGQLTIAGAAGVTVNTPTGMTASTAGMRTFVQAIKMSPNVWDLLGALAG